MRDLLFGDWGTKAVALVLAVVLWAYLYSETEGTKEMDVPFTLEVASKNVASITRDGKPVDPAVHVRFRGPRSALADLDKVPPKCRLKLTDDLFSKNEEKGTTSKSIQRESFDNLPPRVQFEVLPTGALTFSYVMVVQDEVPLRLVPREDLRGQPAPGFVVGNLVANVQGNVKIRRPGNLVVTEARIEPIDVDYQKKTIIQPARLHPALRDKRVELLTDVRVTVEIAESTPAPVTKPVTLPVRLLAPEDDLPFDIRLGSRIATVTLEGPEAEVARVSDQTAYAFIDPKAGGLPRVEDFSAQGEYDKNMPVTGVIFSKDEMRQAIRFKPSPDVTVAVHFVKKK